jgi:hypothetical protein
MKVKTLISYLEEYDPEAEVRIMSQPTYPFEYSIKGVVERQEFSEEFPDPKEGKLTDVFILEGSQIQYGNKKVWEMY